MQDASYLLPGPGGEVVRQLLDEIDSLKHWLKHYQERTSKSEQQLASAHREGWEQAKRECAFIVQNYDHNPDRDGDWADQLDEVIATMEYKGEPND